MTGDGPWLFAGAIATAIITASATIFVVWLQSHRTRQVLGKPNGGGDVVGEIKQVKEAVQQVALLAGTAASAAQMAAAMTEAVGGEVQNLAGRVQQVEHELTLVPRKPF